MMYTYIYFFLVNRSTLAVQSTLNGLPQTSCAASVTQSLGVLHKIGCNSTANAQMFPVVLTAYVGMTVRLHEKLNTFWLCLLMLYLMAFMHE